MFTMLFGLLYLPRVISAGLCCSGRMSNRTDTWARETSLLADFVSSSSALGLVACSRNGSHIAEYKRSSYPSMNCVELPNKLDLGMIGLYWYAHVCVLAILEILSLSHQAFA